MAVPGIESMPSRPMTSEEFSAAIIKACFLYSQEEVTEIKPRKARALCVCFELDKDSHPNVESTSERVRDVFENTYGYDTVGLVIRKQDKNPQATLTSALGGLFNGMDEDCIAILHYIGHGGEGQKFVFPSLRDNKIDPWDANVLILFECCFPIEIDGYIDHHKELIYAYASGESVCDDGLGCERGFSRNLVRELKRAHECGHVLSTSQLYSRLATKSFTMKESWETELDSLPHYIRHPRDHGPSLLLQPMRQKSNLDLTPAPCQTLGDQAADVVLSVQIANGGWQALHAIQSWAQRHPLTEGRVRVDELYKRTDKCILAVTFQVWYNLPDHPAMNQIGFEFKRTTGQLNGL
ncbi:hypothetical protein BFJ63_vAg9087 [Fusarium oxysporum f. sp. narcissi]|uniref:Uncharacterized protein n=1 Tax=Fusarium oxysporum f. sp. narcissi TaxID=451672 RepID=A0A4Q2VNK3_FUSOX|nr:hypothetical protein BFJ63_vAg9087 [Fusarium oxysporum f. sp. narcissi]